MAPARNLLSTVVVVLLFALPNLATAQKRLALEALQSRYRVTSFSFDSNGIPDMLVGKLMPANANGKTLEVITFQFFEESKDVYKLHEPSKELKVERVSKDMLQKTHIRLRQQYKGVPVYGGELITHFDSTGALVCVNGTVVPNIDMNVTPKVSEAKARKVIRDELLQLYDVRKSDIQKVGLLAYPLENKMVLAWDFTAYYNTDSQTGDWEYFIDATTRRILQKLTRIRY